ncbi:hypothetical protein Slin15195_G124690 [Septoria linicola]|uniref:Uncharacterized protein n=1 Tax=Septoria linicola TaxID=215465 RepID=A0A9Q9B1X3_9PEZI|nr:hypothetical protein Slin15195_G124690 [Septoria linicola]
MWYLFRSAPEMLDGVPKATPLILRDWLNLAQFVVHWLCSIFPYVLVITLPSRHICTSRPDLDAPPPINTGSSTTKKGVATTLLLTHAALILITLPIGGQPGFLSLFNIVRFINFVILQPIFHAPHPCKLRLSSRMYTSPRKAQHVE